MNHLVWEDDENETLCGKDVTEAKWLEFVDCTRCLDVDLFLNILEKFTYPNSPYKLGEAIYATIKFLGESK